MYYIAALAFLTDSVEVSALCTGHNLLKLCVYLDFGH